MKFALPLLMVAATAACAQVTGKPVTDANPDPDGLRVRPARSIVVATGAGQEVVQIADPCTEYAVQINAFLATNATVLELNDNGTLKKVDSKLDSTEALGLLEALAGKIDLASGEEKDTVTTQSQLQFYGFSCSDDGKLVMDPLTPAVTMARKIDAPAGIKVP